MFPLPRTLHFPHSFPTQQHVLTPAHSTTRPHSVWNEHRTDVSKTLQGPPSRLLLSPSFVPVATCHTHDLSRVRVSPTYLVFFLLSCHVLHGYEQLAALIVKRASSSSCRQPTYRDRLPLGAAEGPPGTVLLKVCVLTWHLTSHVGRGHRPQPMSAVYFAFRETEQPIWDSTKKA